MIAYNNLIILGRNLEGKHEYSPELILAWVGKIEEQLRWTPVADFFRLFPPIKRYADDGTWDYHSTLDMIQREYGETFGKDALKHLLMTSCYENRFVQNIGYAWMDAVSDLNKRVTGKSVAAQFFEEKGLTIYDETD